MTRPRETLPELLKDYETRISRMEHNPRGWTTPPGAEPGKVLGFDIDGNVVWTDPLPPGGSVGQVVGRVQIGSEPGLFAGWIGPMWWAWTGTQEQYDMLGTYDDRMLYVVVNPDDPIGPLASPFDLTGGTFAAPAPVTMDVTTLEVSDARSVDSVTRAGGGPAPPRPGRGPRYSEPPDRPDGEWVFRPYDPGGELPGDAALAPPAIPPAIPPPGRTIEPDTDGTRIIE